MLGGFQFFENHQFQFFVPYARIGLVFNFEKKNSVGKNWCGSQYF